MEWITVYKLIDENNKVVWVGETQDTKRRLWQHKSKSGKFHNKDIRMDIVTSYLNRKDAYNHQIELQKEYGLITDNDKKTYGGAKTIRLKKEKGISLSWGNKEASRKGGLNNKGNKYNIIERTCPHCNKTGKGSNMTRYHFDNCKNK